VARDLLGKILVVRAKTGETAGRIVEVEAYSGGDPASHSARGETPRSAPMFGPPGRAYVYFIYGMYEMLNFVTESEGRAGAVLIRAVEPVAGIDLMRKRRRSAKGNHSLTNGPGRLTRAMAIRMSDNRAPLQGPRILVLDDGARPASVCASPRVGIREGAGKMWRYFDPDSPFVSPVRQNRQARRV